MGAKVIKGRSVQWLAVPVAPCCGGSHGPPPQCYLVDLKLVLSVKATSKELDSRPTKAVRAS